ncbi:MAG: ABC transporter ATP-binding protein [Lachnospiraceae bacterium]|nr:ABC transporter ATP-binding protein [Lachnospiraceae bacterium]
MRIEAKEIRRDFLRKGRGTNILTAVQECNITFESGTLSMIVGRSGSGKSTLLHMLSGVLAPTAGKVLYEGEDLFAMPDERRSAFRNRHIGFVPQGAGGIASLTVRENILLPVSLFGQQKEGASKDATPEKSGSKGLHLGEAGSKGLGFEKTSSADALQRAEEWMQLFGITTLADARPSELSGGELRRMAIARALIQNPEAIFADEPTGDLDDENTRLVFEMLRQAAKDGAAVVVVTHENEGERYADRLYRMNAGVLTEE